jgi:iron complex outermembrane receptor protein
MAGAEALFRIDRLALEITPSLRAEGSQDMVSGRTVLGGFMPAAPPVVRLQPTARLSIVQHPHEALALKANAGRYARFANFTELYGDSGFIVGSPDLRPESGWNADVGAAWTWHGPRFAVRADGFFFANVVKDLVQYVQGSYGVSRAANVGQARILGVEAMAEVAFGPHARLAAQATFTDARDTTTVAAAANRQLPLRPRGHAYGRAEVRDLPLPWGLALGAYVDIDATGGNYLDPANLVRLDPRLLMGAGASLSWSRHARLVLSARNLTGSRISDFAGYPLPGRSFFATLKLSTHDRSEL